MRSDIDDELSQHLELRAGELEASGLSREDALREARRRFGDLEGTRDYCYREDRMTERRIRTGLMLNDFLQDVKISARGLLKAPALTATVMLTVGLGIGATTTLLRAIDTGTVAAVAVRAA